MKFDDDLGVIFILYPTELGSITDSLEKYVYNRELLCYFWRLSGNLF